MAKTKGKSMNDELQRQLDPTVSLGRDLLVDAEMLSQRQPGLEESFRLFTQSFQEYTKSLDAGASGETKQKSAKAKYS